MKTTKIITNMRRIIPTKMPKNSVHMSQIIKTTFKGNIQKICIFLIFHNINRSIKSLDCYKFSWRNSYMF